jgi:voltage-gated sodium channel
MSPTPWTGKTSNNPFGRVAAHRLFQNSVIVVILANAVIMGLETAPEVMRRVGSLLLALNGLFQAIFVVEITIRLAAYWPRPLRFFREGWNVFDFLVVAVSLLPASGSFANVARLARVLRVGRLVSVAPELRLIIGTMLKSIPSMAHVILLLSVLLYIYGVLGYHLFGAADPARWGSLPAAIWSLFKILTLEGWIDIFDASGASRGGWLFYVSFIFLAVFVVVNLFIAVVINNLDRARAEIEAQAIRREPAEAGDELLLQRLDAVREELVGLEDALKQRGARR